MKSEVGREKIQRHTTQHELENNNMLDMTDHHISGSQHHGMEGLERNGME